MDSAMNTPLLALLGKGALPAGDEALPGDDRALEAAMEFAALLLDAGALGEGGNTLPEPSGNILPVPPAEPEPDAAEDAEAPIAAPLLVVAPDNADDLGGDVAAAIRSARAQPAVLQQAGNRTVQRADTAMARADAGKEVAALQPQPPETGTLLAEKAIAETAAAVAARVDSLRAGVSNRRTPDAGVPRIEGWISGAAPLVRDAGAASVAAVPQLAGPDVMPGDGEWGRQFAERVGWVIQARVPQAQITLNPEHLGPIEMAVEVEDAKARVQFAAAHATTREAIEQSLPRLREMLGQQGLELTQADVGGGQSAPRDGNPAADGDAPGFAPAAETQADETAQADEAPVTATPVVRARGLIDTFV